LSIDLNADVGEGMDDAALLPFVTSANVACGMHAGDPTVMDQTVALALSHGVRVGAHPGYPDRQHFGRASVEISAEAVEDLVLYQVAALDGFVRSRGGTLTHVKPHGALYHSGAEFPDVARAIAEGVRRFRTSLVLVGAAGSMLIEAGRDAGLAVAEEAFADRRYRRDGSLVPRGEARTRPSRSPGTAPSRRPTGPAFPCAPTPSACTATRRGRRPSPGASTSGSGPRASGSPLWSPAGPGGTRASSSPRADARREKRFRLPAGTKPVNCLHRWRAKGRSCPARRPRRFPPRPRSSPSCRKPSRE
jgi:UPF0271 protein